MLNPKLLQWLIGVFASLGSLLFGYDLGVIAEVVACPSFLTTLNQPNTAQVGAVVSIFTGGAFCGAALAGPAGDYLGRKRTILAGAAIFIIGGGLQTGARNINYLYAGRCLAGVGIGFLCMIVPLYQAEISHPSIRGRVTSLQQFMLGIGALCASWISYGTFNGFADTDNNQWRVPLGIQIIPGAILGLLILLFPESPRWLIDHGRAAEGLKTLAKLHAHGDENDTYVVAEYQQITEAIEFEHAHEAKSYIELFKNPSSFRRLFLCCAIQASIQMTGVSAIQYYSPTIYKLVGIDTSQTLKYQGISSALGLLGEFCCMMTVDIFGRRWTLIGFNLLNMCCFIGATAIIGHYPLVGATASVPLSAAYAFIAMTILYNFSFSWGCGPLSWIVPAEIFDTHTRAKGVSIATMMSFAFNTLIGQVTPIAFNHIGWKYYLVFCVCNFTNALFFWAFLPETGKRPLEEMNYLFEKAPIFVPGMKIENYQTHDLERRTESIAAEKQSDMKAYEVEDRAS